MCGRSGESDPSDLADAVFRVLSDEYRRCALYYLFEQESATVEELATVLTGWVRAREDAFEIATPDDRERVRTRLHHVHLPKIEDAGFVRHDRDSGTVALEDRPAMLESVLEQALEEDRHADENRFDCEDENRFDREDGEGNRSGRGTEDRTDGETDRDGSEDP